MGELTNAPAEYSALGTWVATGLCIALAGAGCVLMAPYLNGLPVATIWLAGLLYICSHILRALRLAILSMDMLGVSGRTSALMHFATAPVGLVLPFKSGELLRLHQLWKLSRAPVYALVTLLIDRMYDSLFLVPFLIVFLLLGSAPFALILLTLLAATVPLVVVVLGPKLLNETQRYVLIHHNNPRALGLLPQIDALRVVVSRAAYVAHRRAPEVSLLSFLIWLSEFLVCFVLVSTLSSEFPGTAGQAMDLLGERLVAPWWELEAGSLASQALALATISLLLPWPILVFLYLRRYKDEPRRIPAAWQSETRLAS